MVCLLGVYSERACNNALDENGWSEGTDTPANLLLFSVSDSTEIDDEQLVATLGLFDMRVAPRAEESPKAQMVTDNTSCTCCLAEIGDRADLPLPYLPLRITFPYLIPCRSNLFVPVPTHLSIIPQAVLQKQNNSHSERASERERER